MTYENKLTRETRKRNLILLIWLIGGVAGEPRFPAKLTRETRNIYLW